MREPGQAAARDKNPGCSSLRSDLEPTQQQSWTIERSFPALRAAACVERSEETPLEGPQT